MPPKRVQAMNNEEKDDSIKESLDFTKPDYVFTPNENHDWRQQGPYLICKSCEIQHSTYIGMEKIMVGVDEQGKPLFKNRKELGR